LASLTESFEEYDLASGGDLVIEWTSPGAGVIHLRAHGLQRRLHYRMDTVRPSGSTSYRWPSTILAGLNARRADIGIVGWTRLAVGQVERPVYIGLRVSQRRKPARPGTYELVVLPTRELSEVYVSLAAVGSDGRPTAFLQDGRALRHGYYPAGRAIPVSIAGLGRPGIYYVELGATVKGGDPTTATFWLHHPGP
jgi:hypothetical protein